MTEVQTMMALNHPHVLKCIEYGEGVKRNSKGEEKPVLFIALELA